MLVYQTSFALYFNFCFICLELKCWAKHAQDNEYFSRELFCVLLGNDRFLFPQILTVCFVCYVYQCTSFLLFRICLVYIIPNLLLSDFSVTVSWKKHSPGLLFCVFIFNPISEAQKSPIGKHLGHIAHLLLRWISWFYFLSITSCD